MVLGQPVFNERKRFIGYRGIAKDITASMRSELVPHLSAVVRVGICSGSLN